MTEYPIAQAFLDSRVQTIYGGTTEIQKEIIGRSLGPLARPGQTARRVRRHAETRPDGCIDRHEAPGDLLRRHLEPSRQATRHEHREDRPHGRDRPDGDRRRAAAGALPQRRRRRRPTRSTGCSAARSASACSTTCAPAYRFLALNYEPGDEIFVFGFSRGAYTARSLVGMIGRVGLLTREALVADQLPEAVARYQRRRRPDRRRSRRATSEFKHDALPPGRHGAPSSGSSTRSAPSASRAPSAATTSSTT